MHDQFGIACGDEFEGQTKKSPTFDFEQAVFVGESLSTKIESIVRYQGIEVDDALEMAERTEI